MSDRPKLHTTPHCKRCGTLVEPGVKLCSTCAPIVNAGQSPEFAFQTAKNKRPPYEKPSAINPSET